MNTRKKTMAVLVGSTFAAALTMSPIVHAEQNPFAMKPLSQGYMVAEADQANDGEKMKDGNCSAEMMEKTGTDSAAEKEKEGSCSANMKDKEGSCSAEMK